jgi:hypothetical protein
MAKVSNSDKVILTGTVGSHSYGTATPTSDYDYMSVVVAPPDVYLGLDDWGTSGTVEDGYDDPAKGFVEHKYYELKKFIGMCVGFNPNAVPLLWLHPEHYAAMTPEGAMLVQHRELFNSKKAYHTFSGYAHGQLQKMGGIFNDAEESNKLLKVGHSKIQRWANEEIDIQRLIRDAAESGNSTAGDYESGYLNALLSIRGFSIEECKRIKDGPITGRMGKKRKELREQFGYDVKFAFHTIRLMKMCVEFLRNPEEGLKVYRKGIDDEVLLSIRRGTYKQEEIKAWADELFAEAKEAVKTTALPDEPDEEGIHQLCMDMIRLSLEPTIVTCDCA